MRWDSYIALFFGILILAFAIFSGFSGSFMPFAWASTTSTPQTQTITISVNEVISLTVASGTVPLS
ncbi:MAG: hypothetical protein WCF77_02710, partial [Minisyncoccia bacterium]